MAKYPYILTDSTTLSSSSTGTLELSMGETEEFDANEVFFESTGAFSITAITDSASLPYTNANSTDILPSTMFSATLAQKTNIGKFASPLHISPGNKIKIAITDTSVASNTVRVYMQGVRTVK